MVGCAFAVAAVVAFVALPAALLMGEQLGQPIWVSGPVGAIPLVVLGVVGVLHGRRRRQALAALLARRFGRVNQGGAAAFGPMVGIVDGYPMELRLRHRHQQGTFVQLLVRSPQRMDRAAPLPLGPHQQQALHRVTSTSATPLADEPPLTHDRLVVYADWTMNTRPREVVGWIDAVRAEVPVLLPA